MDRPWLADRALIEMREGKAGQNVVFFLLYIPIFLPSVQPKLAATRI